MADPYPRTVDDIFDDFQKRRTGLVKALTEDVEDLFAQCDPERDNLCLYGERNGRWTVGPPAEEVPAELPEPCLGINFARDGMQRKDWLALVAVHSDAWLVAVAFFYAVKLDSNGRARLFRQINAQPTLFEVVTGRGQAHRMVGRGMPGQSKARPNQPEMSSGSRASAAPKPRPGGRLLGWADVSPGLRGRQAELYWPDDQMWYLVEIQSINLKAKTAKISYTSGELEELDLNEIVNEGHMSLVFDQ